MLHEQIAELLRENLELKAKLDKKTTEPKEIDLKDRFSRKIERFAPDSRGSSTSQEPKPSHFIIRSGQASPKASLIRPL